MDITNVQHGWDVFGSDGQKIGDVAEIKMNYLHVTKGLIFTKELYIPLNAIERVEPDRVYLNVASDQIDMLNWDKPPTAGATPLAEEAQVAGDLPIPSEEAFVADLNDFIEKRDPLFTGEAMGAREPEIESVKIYAMYREEFPGVLNYSDVEAPEEYPEEHA